MTFAKHEVLELHEIATLKTISLTKAKTMKALVTDQKLKDLMQMDIDATTQQLIQYETLLKKASGQPTSTH